MRPSSQRAPRSPQAQPVLTYPIPHQAQKAFAEHLKSGHARNAGLIFDRFAPDTRDSDSAKKAGFEQVRQAVEKADTQLLAALNVRWERDAQAVGAQRFTLKTDWRFITGLGHKGPLEAGFTFNRYGFPILPGSSVKGIARAWAFYQLAEALQAQLEHIPSHSDSDAEPDDRKDLDKASPLNRLERIVSKDDDAQYRRAFAWYYGANPDAFALAEQFRAVFGTTGNAGEAVFLDAIPTQPPKLELDIMNPHFPDYYTDKSNRVAPTDWQSPNPVFFLTVAPKVEFCFAVGWRGKVNDELQECAQAWLMKGMQELGAGAKTSAGYGYFKEDGAAEHKTQTEQIAQTTAPAQPAPPPRPSTRHTAMGKVRYESGKPFIRGEEGQKWRVNWKELRMEALKEKTVVEIEYEKFEDGTYKVVRVTKKGG